MTSRSTENAPLSYREPMSATTSFKVAQLAISRRTWQPGTAAAEAAASELVVDSATIC